MSEIWERLRAAVASAAIENAESESRTVRQYLQQGLVALQDDPARLELLIDQAVRAALEALRQPTDEMELAGYDASCEVDRPDSPGNVGRLLHTCWAAMIDAALSKH